MRKVRLGFLEKHRLNKRGKRDAKLSQFQVYDTGNKFESKDYAKFDKRTNSPIVVSSFITTELSDFNLKRNSILEKKKVIARVYDSSKQNLKSQKMKFSLAIATLDNQINELNAQISLAMTNRDEEIDRLKQKEEATQLPEWKQLYKEKSDATYKKYQTLMFKHYENMYHLLNEKIRLIEHESLILETMRSRYYLRIRYYYGCARKVIPGLPIACLTDENLESLRSSTVLGKHSSTLADACKLRLRLLELLPANQQGDED